MPEFTPDPISGVESIQDLISYIDRQNRLLQQALALAQDRQMEELHVAPERPREFMVVAADGLDWNPGKGRGIYVYAGGIWNLVSLVGVALPPDEEPPPPPTPVETIADLVSLTPGTFSINEGNQQPMIVTVDEITDSPVVINLFSDDTLLATVPATVTIPVGQTQATFNVQGIRAGSVTISAVLNAVTLTATGDIVSPSVDAQIDFTSWETGVPDEETYFSAHTNGTRQEVVTAAQVPTVASVAHGNRCLRTWTQSGDFVKSTTWHRSEYLVSGPYQVGANGTPAGEEMWIALSVFLGYWHFPTTAWASSLFCQHHSTDPNSDQPNTAFEIANTNVGGAFKPHFRVRMHGVVNNNEILVPRAIPFGHAYTPKRDRWYDMVMRFVWRQNNTGISEFWMRERNEAVARKWVSLINVDNMYPGYGLYMKIGKYHPPPPTGTQTDQYNNGINFYNPPYYSSVWHDRMVIGRTAASVLMPDMTLASSLST